MDDRTMQMEGTELEDVLEDQHLESDDTDSTDGAGPDGAVASEEVPERIREQRELFAKMRVEMEKDEAAWALAKNIATYRRLPEDEDKRKEWVRRTVGATHEDEFLEQVAAVKDAEYIDGLIAGETDAIVAARDEIDGVLWTKVLDALDNDPDRRREVVTRVATEHPVSEPTLEPNEDGIEPEIDYRALWHQDAVSPITEDLEGHVAAGLGEIKKGALQLDQAFKDKILAKVAEARAYTPTHPWRAERFEEAAGMLSFARAEHAASRPFGLGGINSKTWYTAPDGTDHMLEVDGFGQKRDSVVENAVSASEAGLFKDGPASDGTEDFDPDSITTLEDAKRLSPVQWATLPPEKREALLRSASAAMEEQDLIMRRGSL